MRDWARIFRLAPNLLFNANPEGSQGLYMDLIKFPTENEYDGSEENESG